MEEIIKCDTVSLVINWQFHHLITSHNNSYITNNLAHHVHNLSSTKCVDKTPTYKLIEPLLSIFTDDKS